VAIGETVVASAFMILALLESLPSSTKDRGGDDFAKYKNSTHLH
jgi:hypothetical protein